MVYRSYRPGVPSRPTGMWSAVGRPMLSAVEQEKPRQAERLGPRSTLLFWTVKLIKMRTWREDCEASPETGEPNTTKHNF